MRRFHPVVFIASLVSPGFGWALRGRFGRAVSVNLLLVGVWLVFAVLWVVFRFFPPLPMLWVSACWLMLILMNGWDAARLEHGEGVSQPSLVAVTALLLFTWLLPIGGLVLGSRALLATQYDVDTNAMFPTLISGDAVLVDRVSYHLTTPRVGDVVLYRPAADGMLHYGRLVAGPGQSVSVEDGRFSVDGEQYLQEPIRDDFRGSFEATTGASPELVNARFESNGQRVYAVSGAGGEGSSEHREYTLGDDEYFVLNDNRTYNGDSRVFGAVRADEILGRPLFVMSSADEVSSRRVGRRIQPPEGETTAGAEASTLR